MIKSVEVLEMDDLMSDLFDHEIEAYEKMPDALSISTILARECEKAGVVDIQRSCRKRSYWVSLVLRFAALLKLKLMSEPE